jgi:hypothetical protein
MNQRRRLTPEEREQARANALALKPETPVHVQEWTDLDGKPIVVTIVEQ